MAPACADRARRRRARSARSMRVERGEYDDAAFNDAERALLAFGRDVVENVRVPEPIFAAARKHFSDQEIVESIVALGFYMMMARLTEATETDLDPAAGMTVYDGGKKRSALRWPKRRQPSRSVTSVRRARNRRAKRRAGDA